MSEFKYRTHNENTVKVGENTVKVGDIRIAMYGTGLICSIPLPEYDDDRLKMADAILGGEHEHIAVAGLPEVLDGDDGCMVVGGEHYVDKDAPSIRRKAMKWFALARHMEARDIGTERKVQRLAVLLGEERGQQVAAFMDVARRLVARGVEVPEESDDGMVS